MAIEAPTKSPRPPADAARGSDAYLEPNRVEALLSNNNVLHVHQPKRSTDGTIQRAVDTALAQNPSIEDPWTIVVHPGFYNEAVVINGQHISLVGYDPSNTVIYTDPKQGAYSVHGTQYPDGTTKWMGYPLTIEAEALPVFLGEYPMGHVNVHGLRFSNRHNPDGTGEGAPNHAAILVKSGGSIYNTVDPITISNCIIDGTEHAVEILGTLYDPIAYKAPPLIHFYNNLVRTAHFGLAAYGDVRLRSHGNQFWINSDGDIPWQDSDRIKAWKTGGIVHGSQSAGVLDTLSFLESHGDSIFMEGSDAKIGTMSGDYAAGVVINEAASGSAIEVAISGLVVRAVMDIADSFTLAGFYVLNGTNVWAAGRCKIFNSMFEVHQVNAAGPTDVVGINIAAVGAGDVVEVANCWIDGTNANGTAYAMETGETINRANVYSRLSNAAGGTYGALATV